jgi:broad specificity phosphatase PhoE
VILHLIRHGETRYNREGLGLGRADAPLTEFGRAQANALGERMANEPIARIYSSPLGRCLETARAVAGGRELLIEARSELIELDVGETEGKTFAAMREEFPEFLAQWASPDPTQVPMPGGESIADLDTRLAPLLRELHRREDETVAVVSHNFVTKVLLCRLLGVEPGLFRSLGIDLASVTSVSVRDGRAFVRKLNDRCHLSALES